MCKFEDIKIAVAGTCYEGLGISTLFANYQDVLQNMMNAIMESFCFYKSYSDTI